jgi:hypothetical protein
LIKRIDFLNIKGLIIYYSYLFERNEFLQSAHFGVLAYIESHSVFNFSLSSSSNPPPITLNATKEISPQQIIAESKDSSIGAPKEGAEGENRAALFSQQQQLINQFMHLNIQLLSRKLENLEHIDRLPRAKEAEAAAETRNAKKKM